MPVIIFIVTIAAYTYSNVGQYFFQ